MKPSRPVAFFKKRLSSTLFFCPASVAFEFGLLCTTSKQQQQQQQSE
jgi:hypothetical protein